MEALDSKQLWRQIPPEEKFDLMAKAQSKGIITAIGAIIIGATLAVGLHLEWLMWGSILLSPIVYQGTASKAWRHIKPQAMLEYLAARSAARRFAFSLNSSRLNVASIIRGKFEEIYTQQEKTEELEAEFEKKREKDVWITLFHDALIVISEQAGGAKLELGQLLIKNLEIEGLSPSGGGEYAKDRELLVKVTNNYGRSRNFRLSSKYPAALIVMEKQIHKLIEEVKTARELSTETKVEVEEEDEFLNFSLN